jgi:hypothetical protein
MLRKCIAETFHHVGKDSAPYVTQRQRLNEASAAIRRYFSSKSLQTASTHGAQTHVPSSLLNIVAAALRGLCSLTSPQRKQTCFSGGFFLRISSPRRRSDLPASHHPRAGSLVSWSTMYASSTHNTANSSSAISASSTCLGPTIPIRYVPIVAPPPPPKRSGPARRRTYTPKGAV